MENIADKVANTVSLLLEALREKLVLIAVVVGESSLEMEKQTQLALKCISGFVTVRVSLDVFVLVYLGELELFILNPAFHYLKCIIR